MRSFFNIFLATVMAITSFFSTTGSLQELINKGDISGYANSVIDFGEIPDMNCDENGDFTVLQFSDTHFTTGLSFGDIRTFEIMKEKTEQYSPDLVVISGDMLDDGNSGAFNKAYVLRKVGEMFDSMKQYWAYIPGNNDGLNYGTTSDIAAYLSQYEYCIIADEKNISGGAQYSIDIFNSNQLVHSLIFLDTMDYDNEDTEHIYGYVHSDQVEWCRQTIESKQTVNPDVKCSIFIHENTPGFRLAAENGIAYSDEYSTIAVSDEKYNIPKNQPLDDVFDTSGCVGLISMGHVHPISNQCSFYENRYYHITAKANNMSTLITIHTSADNVKSMYDFEKVSNISF